MQKTPAPIPLLNRNRLRLLVLLLPLLLLFNIIQPLVSFQNMLQTLGTFAVLRTFFSLPDQSPSAIMHKPEVYRSLRSLPLEPNLIFCLKQGDDFMVGQTRPLESHCVCLTPRNPKGSVITVCLLQTLTGLQILLVEPL